MDMLPPCDTLPPSGCMIRLSRVGASVSSVRSGSRADSAGPSPPLGHLTALLSEMRSAAIPIVEIARQQTERQPIANAA